MKRNSLFLIVILFLTTKLQAQNITGRVIDEQSQAMEYVNVTLLLQTDSTIITGTVTDHNGEFSLQTETSGNSYLQFSFIGHETLTVPAVTNQTIILKAENIGLDEIVVKASRKVFKLENGNLIANVKNTVLESLANASEVISRLPFLNAKDNDFIVFGRGKAIVYINNRLVSDNKELEQLSPSDIKRIEVITSPDATYDATAKAVIRITPEKPTGDGLSGMIYAQGNQASVFSGNEYISLNYRNGTWDVFGSFDYYHKNYKTNFDANQDIFLLNNNHQQIYKTKEKRRNNSQYSIAGVNFNPNKDHSAGIRYSNNNITFRGNVNNNITHTGNDSSGQIQQESISYSPENSHNINAYYNGTVTEKLSLNINSDVLTGNADDRMDTHYTQSPNEILRTNGTRNYNLYAVKGILSFNMDKSVLNAGSEYTHTRITQTYNINNPGLGIENTNDEAIQNRLAFFTSLEVQLGKVGLNAGLRYENINMDYYEKGIKNAEQSRLYNEFFPNISVSYAYDDNIQAFIGYDRKINYPEYGQLRSSVQYSSPFLYESGNPMLQPKIENSFSAILAWKNVQIMAGFSLNENDIFFMPRQYKDQPIILFQFDNVKYNRNTNLGISYTPVIGLWRPNFEIGGIWQKLSLKNVDSKYNQPIFSANWFNTFTLHQEWVLRIDASGRTGGNEGVALYKPDWGIDLRVSKKIFQNKLSLHLTFNDIFKTHTSKWEMNYGIIRMLYDKNIDSRSVSLTISYRFNSTNSKYKGVQASDEINRL